MSKVADFLTIQAALTNLARELIRALHDRGMTYEKIGERLHVSHAWAVNLSKPEQYGPRKVGQELEHRLAELYYGGSVDALRRAALHIANGGRVFLEEAGEPLELRSNPTPSSTPTRVRRTR